MSVKNIISKILGLDRKEKTEPVKPTPQTQQPSAGPPPTGHTPPLAVGLNLPNAAVPIPSPGGEGSCPSGRTEGGLSAPTSDLRKAPSVKSVSSVVKLPPSGSFQFDPDDNRPARRLTGKVA